MSGVMGGARGGGQLEWEGWGEGDVVGWFVRGKDGRDDGEHLRQVWH